jgi:hypothetical protein
MRISITEPQANKLVELTNSSATTKRIVLVHILLVITLQKVLCKRIDVLNTLKNRIHITAVSKVVQPNRTLKENVNTSG